jgi:hypothetical protein
MSLKEITMPKYRSASRIALGVIAVALAGVAGRAQAACDANGNPSPAGSNCFVLKGSDTLFDIMTDAINQSRALGVPGATDLFYAGTGSGNAETAMKTSSASGVSVQSIGPMSRNFRPSFIDALSPDFVPATVGGVCGTASNGTACGHAAWAPGVANVVGLDAAVFVVKSGVALDNLDFGTFTDNSVPTPFKKANKNNAALPTAFGDGSALNNLSSAVNYNNVMSVVLSGVDGSGTIAACADPRRVQAIQDLAGLLGVTTINHLFRRDDNSGTTDTFKDRIMVVDNTGSIATRYKFTGGRFCNGTAVGQINGAAPQQGICNVARTKTCVTNADCVAAASGTVCQYNLNNQDFDPIRRPCSPSTATTAPTSCSDLTTGRTCQASDGNPNCTQGFIVALSDTDPSSTDVTTSIGARVGNSLGDAIGYAGREAASAKYTTKSLGINTIRAYDDRVRDSTYLLARRLFIQNTFVNSALTQDVPNDTQTANSVTGGGIAQRDAEQSVWSNFLSNRSLMDPIVRKYGFIRCASDMQGDGGDPLQETNNLCAITPAAPTPGAFGAYTPSGSFGASNTGGAKSINSAGRVWNGTSAVPATCTSGSLCVSGLACGTGLTCPDAQARPLNAPCTTGTDCASGHCTDVFGHSTGGVDGLYCSP